MEEATELFSIMSQRLTIAEATLAARMASAPRAVASAPSTEPKPAERKAPATILSADDLGWAAVLFLGAGAGLAAALAKRLGAGAPPPSERRSESRPPS